MIVKVLKFTLIHSCLLIQNRIIWFNEFILVSNKLLNVKDLYVFRLRRYIHLSGWLLTWGFPKTILALRPVFLV